jgi:hypothetical protein
MPHVACRAFPGAWLPRCPVSLVCCTFHAAVCMLSSICCTSSVVAHLFSRVRCCASFLPRPLLHVVCCMPSVKCCRASGARSKARMSVARCACRSCLCEPNLMTTPRVPATLHGRRASHICAGTGLIPCHVRTGTGLTAAHICAGTRLTSAASAPGLGRARCSRRCYKSCRMLPRARPSGPRWCCASTTKTYAPAHPCARAQARPVARLRA